MHEKDGIECTSGRCHFVEKDCSKIRSLGDYSLSLKINNVTISTDKLLVSAKQVNNPYGDENCFLGVVANWMDDTWVLGTVVM